MDEFISKELKILREKSRKRRKYLTHHFRLSEDQSLKQVLNITESYPHPSVQPLPHHSKVKPSHHSSKSRHLFSGYDGRKRSDSSRISHYLRPNSPLSSYSKSKRHESHGSYNSPSPHTDNPRARSGSDSTHKLSHKANKTDDLYGVMKSLQSDPQSYEDELKPKFFSDSKTFLKGTQSLNPHNDYSQNFVDTGQRPQNFIRDFGMEERFEEYPKLRELIKLKDDQLAEIAFDPMYIHADLRTYDLMQIGCEFDVILIDPPLEEYQRRAPGIKFNVSPWDFQDLINLPIENIASQRAFVFLWCGSAEGLDLGRDCLRKWGFRRCEDICCVKRNSKCPGHMKHLEPIGAVLEHTKEHCLMGIRGTVRRNTDSQFIHANVDLDIIITEEPEYGNTKKPEEIFHIIEHFCLGTRRLHIFGTDTTIRRGWVTIGPEISTTNFSAEKYIKLCAGPEGKFMLGNRPDIELLRPKSPTKKAITGKMKPASNSMFNSHPHIPIIKDYLTERH